MTKRINAGILSTTQSKKLPSSLLLSKVRGLTAARKIVFLAHANQKMWERDVLYDEVLEVLNSAKHAPSRDRWSEAQKSWQYTLEGHTDDQRHLRIGISVEVSAETHELLLIITVIEPGK